MNATHKGGGKINDARFKIYRLSWMYSEKFPEFFRGKKITRYEFKYDVAFKRNFPRIFTIFTPIKICLLSPPRFTRDQIFNVRTL